MSKPIITVENLGKKYRLNHQAERQRYTALRDVIAEKTKRLFRPAPSQDPRTEEFWALKDVSFEVNQGDVVGIIGRNGAGKSTLLKILSRITEPTTGRVLLRGRVASLLEVGTGFHPELTGRENIYLNGAILGMTRAEIRSKFDEIVAFAEVEKFLDTPVKRYSSGMYVRLAFAVAAHLEPEILVIDEVLAVGDTEFQKKCLGKMEDVSKGGRTVLFVSHNMSAIQALCGTGILLKEGQLRHIGPIDSATGEYLRTIRGKEMMSAALGPDLQLTRLELRPALITSGKPVSLQIQLDAGRKTLVKELALLIYSDLGARLGVLDLRNNGPLNLEISGNPLNISIFVPTLPLIEGDYRLGLYVVTDKSQGNHLDLLSFSVAPNRKDLVSYAPRHRGFLELEFSASIETPQMVEDCVS